MSSSAHFNSSVSQSHRSVPSEAEIGIVTFNNKRYKAVLVAPKGDLPDWHNSESIRTQKIFRINTLLLAHQASALNAKQPLPSRISKLTEMGLTDGTKTYSNEFSIDNAIINQAAKIDQLGSQRLSSWEKAIKDNDNDVQASDFYKEILTSNEADSLIDADLPKEPENLSRSQQRQAPSPPPLSTPPSAESEALSEHSENDHENADETEENPNPSMSSSSSSSSFGNSSSTQKKPGIIIEEMQDGDSDSEESHNTPTPSASSSSSSSSLSAPPNVSSDKEATIEIEDDSDNNNNNDSDSEQEHSVSAPSSSSNSSSTSSRAPSNPTPNSSSSSSSSSLSAPPSVSSDKKAAIEIEDDSDNNNNNDSDSEQEHSVSAPSSSSSSSSTSSRAPSNPTPSSSSSSSSSSLSAPPKVSSANIAPNNLLPDDLFPSSSSSSNSLSTPSSFSAAPNPSSSSSSTIIKLHQPSSSTAPASPFIKFIPANPLDELVECTKNDDVLDDNTNLTPQQITALGLSKEAEHLLRTKFLPPPSEKNSSSIQKGIDLTTNVLRKFLGNKIRKAKQEELNAAKKLNQKSKQPIKNKNKKSSNLHQTGNFQRKANRDFLTAQVENTKANLEKKYGHKAVSDAEAIYKQVLANPTGHSIEKYKSVVAKGAADSLEKSDANNSKKAEKNLGQQLQDLKQALITQYGREAVESTVFVLNAVELASVDANNIDRVLKNFAESVKINHDENKKEASALADKNIQQTPEFITRLEELHGKEFIEMAVEEMNESGSDSLLNLSADKQKQWATLLYQGDSELSNNKECLRSFSKFVEAYAVRLKRIPQSKTESREEKRKTIEPQSPSVSSVSSGKNPSVSDRWKHDEDDSEPLPNGWTRLDDELDA